MNNLKFAAFDAVIFFASRLLDAIALAALMWLVATIDKGSASSGSLEANLYGIYLIVRAYFIVFGFLLLSAAVFVAMEFFGGIHTRARLLFLNVGVLLLHGLALGFLLRLGTPAYWTIGVGMLLFSALATNWLLWPWLLRQRHGTTS